MEKLDIQKQNILSDLIEQGAHESALELLKGDHHFSEDELNKSLISACHHGNKHIVQTLVQLGANINCRDTNGNTPFLISVLNGMTDNIQFLLTNKAEINAANSVGDTALILSVRSSGSTEITKTLLEQPGLNIDHQNQDGYTAIMTAAEVTNVNTLKILLDKYCNIQSIETSTENLLKQLEINIDHQKQPYYRSDVRATEVQNFKTLQMLLDRYCNIQSKTPSSQCCEPTDECKTHKHASNNVSDSVDRLTTLGETINRKGENVHQIAERCGIGSIFKLLQEYVSTKISPLELAMRANDIKSFHIFLDCDFLYTPGRKVHLDEVFLNIFQKFNDKSIIQFTEIEITMIKALLEHGAEVNSTWRDQRNQFRIHELQRLFSTAISLQRPFLYKSKRDPIQIAAKSGCVKVLELLLLFKVNVNRYEFYNSPLHIALSHDHIECAKLLIQHGANFDFNRAFELAVSQQKPKYVTFLIENCEQLVTENMKDMTKIHHVLLLSVRKGNLEIIGHILDLGANIDGIVGSEMCPLAESKNAVVAKFLIDRGAKVNHIINSGEISSAPLFAVIRDKDLYSNSVLEVIQVLLENGASVNDRNWCGETALMLAAGKEGSSSVLQLLLDHGADLSKRDNEGNTALIHASRKGCSQSVLLLLQFMQDRKQLLNVQSNSGFTALMYAVSLRNKLIIKNLIVQGADVNIKDTNGNTAILRLLLGTDKYLDKLEILRSLIQAGCDVDCQNDEGISPLMLAAQDCLEDVIRVLLDSGAEINAVNKRDNTETAITYLLKRPYLQSCHFSCLEYLLHRGAILSYVDADAFHKMIVAGQVHIVSKLIRCGFGPVSITQDNVLSLLGVHDTMSCYSPLFTALWVGNHALAHFFVGNLFLTHSDVSLLGHSKLVRQHLEMKNYKQCLNILNEISTQPMTLLSLSFVALATALGTAPGRETRVNELPLPQIVKDKLLFKSHDVELTV